MKKNAKMNTMMLAAKKMAPFGIPNAELIFIAWVVAFARLIVLPDLERI
jgi:hypothetical protein